MINMYVHKDVVRAIQYTGSNGTEIKSFTKGQVCQSPILEPTKSNPTGSYLEISANDGWMGFAYPGDYIVMNEKGTVSCWNAEGFNYWFTDKEMINNGSNR